MDQTTISFQQVKYLLTEEAYENFSSDSIQCSVDMENPKSRNGYRTSLITDEN